MSSATAGRKKFCVKRAIPFALALSLLLCRPCFAYMPEGSRLLEIMLSHMGVVESLFVQNSVNVYTENDGTRRITETLIYDFPHRFRSDSVSTQAHRIYVKNRNKAVAVFDDVRVTDTDSVFDIYKDILLYRDKVLLEEHLKKIGCDISIVSLGRFEKRRAFVLGDEYPRKIRTQLWIDKETFFPFRLILPDKSYSPDKRGSYHTIWEIRYRKWRQKENFFYPSIIDILGNGKLFRRMETEEVELNPEYSEKLMDMERIRSLYPEKDKAIANNSGKLSGIQAELNEIMDNFRKMYRLD